MRYYLAQWSAGAETTTSKSRAWLWTQFRNRLRLPWWAWPCWGWGSYAVAAGRKTYLGSFHLECFPKLGGFLNGVVTNSHYERVRRLGNVRIQVQAKNAGDPALWIERFL